MMDLDENKRPTASEVLPEFMQLYEHLTVEQLRSPVICNWTNSKLISPLGGLDVPDIHFARIPI